MRAIAMKRKRLRATLREAADDVDRYKQERQDTQAAIRRAEAAGNEREATRLRRELPVIERAISRASQNHDQAKTDLEEFEQQYPGDG